MPRPYNHCSLVSSSVYTTQLTHPSARLAWHLAGPWHMVPSHVKEQGVRTAVWTRSHTHKETQIQTGDILSK